LKGSLLTAPLAWGSWRPCLKPGSSKKGGGCYEEEKPRPSKSPVNHTCQQIFYKLAMDVGTPSGCLISAWLLLWDKGDLVKENNLDEFEHSLL